MFSQAIDLPPQQTEKEEETKNIKGKNDKLLNEIKAIYSTCQKNMLKTDIKNIAQ